ncbi:hypothetical protein EVAR_61327_1 [Eumeta japonica]|uniref:Uncharacterized protein n=1 Tax=Eumeta variegata TaxID=151549 RepID=A0A4C1Y3Y2_EUMVA|nr:hypothetical protein EVAR_61327_1 [Eumeta japonica]
MVHQLLPSREQTVPEALSPGTVSLFCLSSLYSKRTVRRLNEISVSSKRDIHFIQQIKYFKVTNKIIIRHDKIVPAVCARDGLGLKSVRYKILRSGRVAAVAGETAARKTTALSPYKLL